MRNQTHDDHGTGSESQHCDAALKFDAYLDCGIPAYESPTLRCCDCGHDKWVAFGCRLSRSCPPCGMQRVSRGAAHRVDRVLLHVPLPMSLRLLPAAEPKLMAPLLQVAQPVTTHHLLDRSQLEATEGRGGKAPADRAGMRKVLGEPAHIEHIGHAGDARVYWFRDGRVLDTQESHTPPDEATSGPIPSHC